MANQTKWSTPGTFTKILDDGGVNPTFKNLTNNSMKLGAEVNNESAKDMLCDFEMRTRFGTNPSAGGYMALYMVPAIDGTNYADGDDSITPPQTYFIGNFPVRAVTTQQRVALTGIRQPPFKWKPLVINKSGQTTTNTNNENELAYRAYNPELQ